MCTVAKETEAPPTLKDAGHPSWKDEADSEFAHTAEVRHVLLQIKSSHSSDELDQAVQEAKLLEASDINNAGIDEQLSYLNSVYGIDWLRKRFT